MRTARSSPYRGSLGSLPDRDHLDGDPSVRDPLDKNPLDRDPPHQEGTWRQAARQEATSCRDPLPPMGRITDMCKNITLLQVSFEGGNKQESWKNLITHHCEPRSVHTRTKTQDTSSDHMKWSTQNLQRLLELISNDASVHLTFYSGFKKFYSETNSSLFAIFLNQTSSSRHMDTYPWFIIFPFCSEYSSNAFENTTSCQKNDKILILFWKILDSLKNSMDQNLGWFKQL